MKAKALIALALAAGLTAGAAQAAYTGPSAGPTLEKVQVILDDGIDDQGFRVTGFIMKKVGDERYNRRRSFHERSGERKDEGGTPG